MYKVDKVRGRVFIYNSDGANITINHAGKVIRSLKEGRQYTNYSRLRPAGSLWMFDGDVCSWFKLPDYMMLVQGEQCD